MTMENRREFMKQMGMLSALSLAGVPALASLHQTTGELPLSKGPKMPQWKGFNLLNKFNSDNQTPFDEKDFEIIAEWGFNFVRLPLSYWCWSSKEDWYVINESILKEIDRAVELGNKYKLHININFHRAPGYCINNTDPKYNLFEDEEPLKACEYHWKLFAERYKSYSNKDVSFNLINEAPNIEDAKYDRVARRLIDTIRSADPKRLIIVDGIAVGSRPLLSLIDVPDIIQSGRGYQPMLISHYGANWVYGDKEMYYPKEQLSWPLLENGKRYDKDWLRDTLNNAWKTWIEKGGKVHIGEFGCHNQTPHDVALAWLSDQFDIFRENGWGWSLWNLSGSFGVLDSYRKDVKYENFKRHKLDRKMLELLKKA